MLLILVPLWGALVAPGVPSFRQVPDSTVLRRYGDAVNATADTLDMLRGMAQAFRNDLQTASPTIILARATSVQSACASGVSSIRRLQGMLAARTISTIPLAVRDQAKFRTTSEETVAALERCVRSWQPLPRTDDRADTLRSWGPYRVNEIAQALHKFDGARAAFVNSAGLPGRPVVLPPHANP
ncbi:MAG TPA: hypothetical protein VH163_03075 [Gemmatimonadales bacterium]|jgi:hypothetical protein|nr:hypothetical protein [Gemmatimonadales bacterium]